ALPPEPARPPRRPLPAYGRRLLRWPRLDGAPPPAALRSGPDAAARRRALRPPDARREWGGRRPGTRALQGLGRHFPSRDVGGWPAVRGGSAPRPVRLPVRGRRRARLRRAPDRASRRRPGGDGPLPGPPRYRRGRAPRDPEPRRARDRQA